jgi:hypothetical protein
VATRCLNKVRLDPSDRGILIGRFLVRRDLEPRGLELWIEHMPMRILCDGEDIQGHIEGRRRTG